MTNLNVIENQISQVKKYLHLLKIYQKLPFSQIKEDQTIQGAVERYLYLATQSSIDLAETVISYKNFRKPTTYRESFEILHENKLITRPLLEKMISMTGFRNLITHDYADLDQKKVYHVLTKNLKDIEQFIKIIESSLI